MEYDNCRSSLNTKSQVMACIWNIEVSLRFVCVRRRLGSKDTEFGSGARLLVP